MPVVTGGLFVRLLLRAHSVQPFFGTKTVKGVIFLQQRFCMGRVGRLTLTLSVWAVSSTHIGTFVPIQPQPTQRIKYRLFRGRSAARLIRVFDPQHKLPAVMTGKGPVEQRHVGSTHMRVTRG